MPYPFKKIRTKLVMLNLLVFGIIQIAVSILIIGLRDRELHRKLDKQLFRRVLEDCRKDCPYITLSRPQLVMDDEAAPFVQMFNHHFVQIRDGAGKTVFRSANLGYRDLPWSPQLLRVAQQGPGFETLQGAQVDHLLGEGQSMRVVMFRDDSHPPYYVECAASREIIKERISSLRQIVSMATPIGLVAVGLGSYLMARRALSPIGRIVRQAQELTAEQLDRRIEVPEGRDELAEMVIVLNQMLDRLQGAFRAQERFIADAAHELKTPLALLLGKAQVVAQLPRSTEEYEQYLRVVESEARRLGKIVESLLVLARTDAGLPLPRFDPISINEVVLDAVHECRAYAEPRQVRLSIHLANPSSGQDAPMVRGDAGLLLVMFSNVIRNAISFSPSGDVVDIRISRDSRDAVSIVVADNGPGIPQFHIDRLFERFHQVSTSVERPPGTGLGLTIAKGVAKMHGGGISVANMSAGGCSVVFSLPCLIAQN